jgi:hypothetical protein
MSETSTEMRKYSQDLYGGWMAQTDDLLAGFHVQGDGRADPVNVAMGLPRPPSPVPEGASAAGREN